MRRTFWHELILRSIYERYSRSRSLNELVRTEGCRRYLCAAVACAARKPQGRAALIKQTQCTTQFCIQVGCPSPRRWFPRTIDRYYLGVQWTPSKSLRYLYLSSAPSSRTRRRFTMDFRAVQSLRDRFTIGSIVARILTPFQIATLPSLVLCDGIIKRIEKNTSFDWKNTRRCVIIIIIFQIQRKHFYYVKK